MATHSSTIAWKIPWMAEPGGLQTMGSQRVRRPTDYTRRLWRPAVYLPCKPPR